MKKLLIIVSSILFFTSTAYSAGMVGIKLGVGEIDADGDAYTSGSTSYAASSKSKDSEYGAIFAEFSIPSVDGLSIGLEYVPFEAKIRLDKKESGTGATVDQYKTLYVQYMTAAGSGSVYGKIGYSHADIGAITNSNSTSVDSQDDSLQGPMAGIGFQTPEFGNGVFGRLEATYTDFDDVSVTTTSNGSPSVKKTGSGEMTTLSVSIAKSF